MGDHSCLVILTLCLLGEGGGYLKMPLMYVFMNLATDSGHGQKCPPPAVSLFEGDQTLASFLKRRRAHPTCSLQRYLRDNIISTQILFQTISFYSSSYSHDQWDHPSSSIVASSWLALHWMWNSMMELFTPFYHKASCVPPSSLFHTCTWVLEGKAQIPAMQWPVWLVGEACNWGVDRMVNSLYLCDDPCEHIHVVIGGGDWFCPIEIPGNLLRLILHAFAAPQLVVIFNLLPWEEIRPGGLHTHHLDPKKNNQDQIDGDARTVKQGKTRRTRLMKMHTF